MLQEGKFAAGRDICQHLSSLPTAGIRAIAGQDEPIGRQISKMEIADGLILEKVRNRLLSLLHCCDEVSHVRRPGNCRGNTAPSCDSGNHVLSRQLYS